LLNIRSKLEMFNLTKIILGYIKKHKVCSPKKPYELRIIHEKRRLKIIVKLYGEC